jgi:hypothetical protein
MRRARRFPQRLVRWMSLCVCLALVLTSQAMVPLTGTNNSIALAQGSDSPNGKGRKVTPAPPERGAPAANLPNLCQRVELCLELPISRLGWIESDD